MKKITCNLYAILQDRGMTQTELAKRTGLNHNTIYSYCVCRSLPSEAKAMLIAIKLNLGMPDIWPHYFAEKAALYRRRGETLRKTLAARKWPSRQPEYKADKHVKSDLRKVRAAVPVDPNDANAVPMCDEARGDDFRLRPAHTSDEDLQDRRWCRAHAARLHKWLIVHCAWGVYQELRSIMASENRLAEERAKVAKGREHVG